MGEARELEVGAFVRAETVIGTPEIVSQRFGSTLQDWRIEGGSEFVTGISEQIFRIDEATGQIAIIEPSLIDFEQQSAHELTVSVSDGVRRSPPVTITIEFQRPPKVDSLLWGEAGELWNTYSRLPDWSNVGYRWGEEEIPDRPEWPVFDITDYGAIAGDDLDDSAAILAAVAAAPASGGIVFMPSGRFIVSEVVNIDRSNLILRGSGRDEGGTEVFFPRPVDDFGLQFISEHMIQFRGGGGRIVGLGRREIIAEAARGDRTVLLNGSLNIEPGDKVHLRLVDDAPIQGTLWLHLNNRQAAFNEDPAAFARGGGDWVYTVARVEGNLVTFREPLKTDIRLEWQPQLTRRQLSSEVGAEDFKLSFPDIPRPIHLREPGYNGLGFRFVEHGWMRRLEFENGDNPLIIWRSSHCTMDDIRLTGRPGHHGPTSDYDGSNLIKNIEFDQTGAFIHSITFTHKATANVAMNIRGNRTVLVDFHGNSPMQNLFTNILTPWGEGSSGSAGAQPHSAHGATFWNNPGTMLEPLDENYRFLGTTIVGTAVAQDSFTELREWNERLETFRVPNIYEAQLARRLNPPVEPPFGEGGVGLRSNWFERDPARWRVTEGDRPAYEILFGDAPAAPGGRLPTYSIFDESPGGAISAEVKSLADTSQNPEADVALVLGYQDNQNYYFATINGQSGARIMLVQNGGATELTSDTQMLLWSGEEVNMSFMQEGDTLILSYGEADLRVDDETFFTGRAGLGSMKGEASFRGVALTEPAPPEPPTPVVHWSLDEGSGLIAEDVSGNGFDGRIEDGASWGSDDVRTTFLSFDGVNDHVATDFENDLTSATTNFTWTAWRFLIGLL